MAQEISAAKTRMNNGKLPSGRWPSSYFETGRQMTRRTSCISRGWTKTGLGMGMDRLGGLLLAVQTPTRDHDYPAGGRDPALRLCRSRSTAMPRTSRNGWRSSARRPAGRTKPENSRSRQNRYGRTRRAAVLLVPPGNAGAQMGQPDTARKQPIRKVGRNQPCPCGSARKFKKCCGDPARN